ncbi:N-acetylmuramoyl-L-alanine amidase [Sporomusaceae bacterium BoRhaA]|uniref:N-acetylmuramoyl-L-alanine amidase n=1 Tax=Pelorhabdus rhamnosifermentans TaxID=2772457 RepID=UPI001C063BE4|nr:N-acetylmuramoyl-L-alanine amidase [Pelorhabdus rhamnosifermentans]MBU2700598.1 N-acetylmuramoyl-L-alanine amidase [Pelorhabdus rhamnosifermentans]
MAKFCIDPGHAPNGEPDPGAVNSDTGLRECDVALTIGNKVAQYLQEAGYEISSPVDNNWLACVWRKQ